MSHSAWLCCCLDLGSLLGLHTLFSCAWLAPTLQASLTIFILQDRTSSTQLLNSDSLPCGSGLSSAGAQLHHRRQDGAADPTPPLGRGTDDPFRIFLGSQPTRAFFLFFGLPQPKLEISQETDAEVWPWGKSYKCIGWSQGRQQRLGVAGLLLHSGRNLMTFLCID